MSNPCAITPLHDAAWTGLPLWHFRPEPHDAALPVASPRHSLFLWNDGASGASVHSRGAVHHYRRGDGVLDLMAAHEQARIAHDRPQQPGQGLVIWVDLHERAGAGRCARHAVVSRFGFRDPLLHALARTLQQQCTQGEPYGRIYTETLSLALSAHVLARYTEAPGPAAWQEHGATARGQLSPRQRALLDSYIRENLQRDVGLAEMADLIGCSRPHFVRLFRRAFGAAPHQYLIGARIEHAKRLLRCDGNSLAEIAALCGFNDASHFSNCFARMTGMPPGRFREARPQ